MSETKKSKTGLYLLGLIALIALFSVPFLISPGAEFGGADDGAGEVIESVSPGYEPWFSSFWEPPGETESMLFALQAAIGAIVIGYVIGYLRGSSAQ